MLMGKVGRVFIDFLALTAGALMASPFFMAMAAPFVGAM